MVLMTMIARVSDGLPLAASVQDDRQVSRGISFSIYSLFFRLHFLFLFCSHTLVENFLPSLQMGRSVVEYQNQAKMLFRKLTYESPRQMSLESGSYLFQ